MSSFRSTARPASAIELFKRFFPYALRLRRAALASAILVLVQPFFTIGLLWTGKVLVDDVLLAGHTDQLTFFATLYALVMTGKLGIDYLTARIEAGVVQHITQLMRVDLYSHFIRMSPGSLPSEGAGSLLARLQGDTEQTEYLVYTAPLAILADGAAALFLTGALFFLSWQLTLCTLLALPAIAWFSARLAPAIRKASRQSRQAEAHWMSLAEERLEALPMVHAFDGEAREVAAFSGRAGRARSREVAAQTLMAWQAMLIEASAAAGGLLVLSAGAYLISTGAMTAGALVAFIGSVASAYAPVRALAKASGRIQHAAASAQRLAAILDQPSHVTEAPDAVALVHPQGAIEFRNVVFAYPGQERVLDGVSFRVEPGETVALVGASGSGKSSLIRLLLRAYDPQSGAVLIGGQDLRTLRFENLRRAIAPVFQDPYIVSGSIASNICYGASGLPAGRIAAAARTSAVDRFVDLPAGGLAGATGPRGTLLSGGQRQRIALARALIKDAPILVLDEATGAVDSETEELIQNALENLSGTRTMFVVAHRLSSVRRADRVIVLENGRVVECGTPAELFSRGSRARDLFASQVDSIGAAA